MSQKRQQQEEGTSFDEKRPRKSKSFKSVVQEVMSVCKLQHLMVPVLEPIIRRVVSPGTEILASEVLCIWL